jgi:tetratricopeptide (TPR) repeat protein
LARKAVDDYLTRVGQNPLLKEQGLHELRQELLEAALRYYRDFLGQRGDDPSLKAEAATAQERVGDIFIELGRPRDALAAYDQALALVEPLARARPGDPATATAQVRVEAGRVQALKEGWYPEAIAAFDRMKQRGEALLAAGAATEDLPNILARAHLAAAIVLRNSGRIDDALRAALRAHELAERATRDHPGDLSPARIRLYISAVASDVLQTKGRDDEARRLCERDIAFGNDRVLAHPRDVEIRLYLALLGNELGELEHFARRQVEALKLFRSSTEALGALAREHPTLIRVRNNWANGLFKLSNLQADLGQYAAAQQSARASIEVNEALVRDVPSNRLYLWKLGWAYGALGKALLKSGSHGDALAMLRKSAAILETSVDLMDLYNLACYLALASTAADPAEGPASAERQHRDADLAVATIRRAIAMGFKNSDALKNDPDFDSLRARPDFHALLMDLAFPSRPFVGGD